MFWKSIPGPCQQVEKAATEIVSRDIRKKSERNAFRFQEEQAVKDKTQGRRLDTFWKMNNKVGQAHSTLSASC